MPEFRLAMTWESAGRTRVTALVLPGSSRKEILEEVGVPGSNLAFFWLIKLMRYKLFLAMAL